MPISENMVQEIVQEVMAKMQIADAPAGKHGIFKDMNDAIEAAKKSQAIVKKIVHGPERKDSYLHSVKNQGKMRKSWRANHGRGRDRN